MPRGYCLAQLRDPRGLHYRELNAQYRRFSAKANNVADQVGPLSLQSRNLAAGTGQFGLGTGESHMRRKRCQRSCRPFAH